MKKLGLLGRWAEFPPTGMTFDNPKARTITIEFNTTAKVAIVAQELDQGASPSRVGGRILLGTVDGLETFEFRATGPVLVEVVYTDEAPSKVWYHTEEGRNFAIDGEHLRDLTVPMVGRRERNPEMEAFQYEMKQQFAAYGDMFMKFMKAQTANAAPIPSEVPAEKKPAKSGAGSGGVRSDKLRPSAEVDPERTVSEDDEVSGSAEQSDPEGSEPTNP